MTHHCPNCESLAKRVEELEEALQKVEDWSNAYPVEVFTEPDWEEAKRLLGPEFLTRISAANMRYVVKGVGEIARAALTKEREGEE